MSVSTEVQRTLVKSPPELWSELSNPEALARHLGELGEIRITSIEPETKVEWEAEGATGVVQLKQSGWGTKVTLSVTRVPHAPAITPQPAAEEPEQLAETETKLEPVTGPDPEPTAEAEPEPVTGPDPEAIPEPAPVTTVTESLEEAEVEPVAEVKTQTEQTTPTEDAETEPDTEPAPRRGFFARIFRRRRVRPDETLKAKPAPEPVAVRAPEPQPSIEAIAEPEPQPTYVALAVPEPIYPLPAAEPINDLAGELESVEAQMTHETTELLTGVLDRLGAAHHRPFSRG